MLVDLTERPALPEVPMHFEFNIPAEYVFNGSPDHFITIKSKCYQTDGKLWSINEIVDMNILLPGLIKTTDTTNWLSLARLIEEVADAKWNELLQVKIKAA